MNILPGDKNKSTRYSIIKRSVEVSQNARHFIACLQNSAVTLAIPEKNSPLNSTSPVDFNYLNHSEFDSVRKFWAILGKPPTTLQKSSRTHVLNNFAQIPNFYSWILFNTSTVITEFEKLVQFLEMASTLESISSFKFYEPLIEENVNTAAIITCSVFPDWCALTGASTTVQYPPFLRKQISLSQKPVQSSVQFQLNKTW